MTWVLLLLAAAAAAVAAEEKAFQGTCSTSLCSEICVALSDETYRCDCWEGRRVEGDGRSCRAAPSSEHHRYENERMTVKTARVGDDSWIEKIKTAPPAYNKDSSEALSFDSHNYAHFTAPDSAYLETNVSIEFRSDSLSDGLLFFGGMYAEEDFIALALVGGNIVLRYDCGEGISTELYYGPFSLHKWHSIRVNRKYCIQSEITVDAMATIRDVNELYENYKGISMSDGFFLGGAPSDVEFLETKTTVTGGFRGCIRRLVINSEILLDSSMNINKMINREMIKPCQQLEKIEQHSEEKTEGLIRKVDHMHKPVAAAAPATPAAAAAKSSVAPETTPTSTTIKPTTTSTSSPTTIHEPIRKNISVEFNGGLFLEQPSPIEIEEYIDLDIHFKPKSDKGLLFHWEDHSHRLSVFLNDGFLNVDLSLGGDDSVLRSPSPVSLNAWHNVQVFRSGKGILMKVDKQRFVDTEVFGTDRKRIKAGRTFIGGSNIKLPANVQAVGNFVGCMKKVRLNTHLLSLTHAPSRAAEKIGRTVSLPPVLPLCNSDPCSSAKCPGDCASTANFTRYSCLCSFPTFGDRCGSTFSMAEGAMRMNGDGYLQLSEEAVMTHITGDSLQFSMEIKHSGKIEKDQILAYTADPDGEDDFMQIALNRERKIVVTMNLGSGEVRLVNNRPIPEGKWTTVEVIRKARSVRLTVNDEPTVIAEAPEGSEQLNVYRALFIGGREPHLHLAEDGFAGCIEWIKIDNVVITSPRQASKSINVQPCHST